MEKPIYTYEQLARQYPEEMEFAQSVFDAAYPGVTYYASDEEARLDVEAMRENDDWEIPSDFVVWAYREIFNSMLREQLGEVVNASGKEINFEASIDLMDDEIRERLHEELAPCTDQEFFTAYEKAHEEKFGEPWELSKANPVW